MFKKKNFATIIFKNHMFRIGLYISIKIQVDVTTYKVDINIECI
jgi:hypothetical protein